MAEIHLSEMPIMFVIPISSIPICQGIQIFFTKFLVKVVPFSIDIILISERFVPRGKERDVDFCRCE